MNQKKQGPFTKYYKNRYSGLVRERGSYKEGRLDGLWEEFYENGNLKTCGTYFEEIPVGTWEYFSEGGNYLRKQSFNRKGEPEGSFEYYHENGMLEVRGNILNDQYSGIYEEYYSNGQLSQKGNFENGARVGRWDYFLKNSVPVDEDYYFSYKEDLLEKSLEIPRENEELEKELDFVLAAGYYVFHADNEILEKEPNRLKVSSFIKELNKWKQVCGEKKASEFHREYTLHGLDEGVSTGKQYEYLYNKVIESSAEMKNSDKVAKIFATQKILEIVNSSGFISEEESEALDHVLDLIQFDKTLLKDLLRSME